MNHAKRVKELKRLYCKFAMELHTADAHFTSKKLDDAIDAMQSALDDANAKLAARDAEVERLTNALAYQKERTRQESKRVYRLEEFLKRQGLLVAEFCRPSGRETTTGNWWVLWPVYMVDRTKPPLGYGKSEAEAIDAAPSEEVKGGE